MRQFPCSSPQEWYVVVCVLLWLVLEPCWLSQTCRPLAKPLTTRTWWELEKGIAASYGVYVKYMTIRCMHLQERKEKIRRFIWDDVVKYNMDRHKASVCGSSCICWMRTWISSTCILVGLTTWTYILPSCTFPDLSGLDVEQRWRILLHSRFQVVLKFTSAIALVQVPCNSETWQVCVDLIMG